MDEQFSFITGRSTELNVFFFANFMSESFKGRCQVHVFYTDFSKVFDRINHIFLIYKLKKAIIAGPPLNCYETYLANRTEIVRVLVYESRMIQVLSGVIQGSHLGPLW